MVFPYGEKEKEYLSEHDDKLGAFIAQCGHIEREVFTDSFSGMCYNIVNQQLSMKACDTLWGKLIKEVGEVTPHSCLGEEKLRACGLSGSKACSIAELSRRVIAEEIKPQLFPAMRDEDITARLTAIKGIGLWTAEMTLIFCLAKPDVLSLSDYGIRKGLSLLHGMDVKDKKAMERYREIYSPYGTTASLYLWERARLG